jgi:hypothetical protein
MAVTLAEDDVGGTKIYPLPVNRAPSAPELEPLSPARDNLRQAIATLHRLQREADELGLPAQRYHAVLAEGERRGAVLAAAHAADRVGLAARIAGGETLLTFTSRETEDANLAALEYQEVVAAARLP